MRRSERGRGRVCGPEVDVNQGAEGLEVEYRFRPNKRERALAVAKLEYLVQTVMKMCGEKSGSDEGENDHEGLLGQALFAYAILTRQFPHRADVFYLNLALGLELADNLRGTIGRCFGWERWTNQCFRCVGMNASGEGK